MNNTAENVELEEDEGFEVEIEDSAEEAKEEPVKDETKEVEDDSESSDKEVDNYSERVQKRIDQLKFEYHEERRAKEAAAQLQEEAIKYAEQELAVVHPNLNLEISGVREEE